MIKPATTRKKKMFLMTQMFSVTSHHSWCGTLQQRASNTVQTLFGIFYCIAVNTLDIREICREIRGNHKYLSQSWKETFFRNV